MPEAVAQAGKLEPLLTAIAIDGKWLRGIADGTEKLFAAMLQEEKVIPSVCRATEPPGRSGASAWRG